MRFPKLEELLLCRRNRPVTYRGVLICKVNYTDHLMVVLQKVGKKLGHDNFNLSMITKKKVVVGFEITFPEEKEQEMDEMIKQFINRCYIHWSS